MACQNETLFVTAGIRRVVAQPKATGVVVEATIDNTTPYQLRTMAGVVEKMLQSKETEKERARGKYAKDKAKRRPGEPVKQ